MYCFDLQSLAFHPSTRYIIDDRFQFICCHAEYVLPLVWYIQHTTISLDSKYF